MVKKNGGYALGYVLVVIILLSLVAVGIASAAMTNLNNQSERTYYMQDLYEAEGQIEEFWAKAYNLIIGDIIPVPSAAGANNANTLESAVRALAEENENGTAYYELGESTIISDNSFSIIVIGHSANGDVSVEAEIKFGSIQFDEYEKAGDIIVYTDGSISTQNPTKFKLIKSATMEYTSYNIIRDSGGGTS